MPAKNIEFSEADVVKLLLEFLDRRKLFSTMLALEREAGIVNGGFSEDLLFLRQLVIDGSWDDAIEFLQPIHDVAGFEADACAYQILKCKYLELLHVRNEGAANQAAIESSIGTQPSASRKQNELITLQIAQCLRQLERVATKNDYGTLCVLQTLNSIALHPTYANWTLQGGRVECFHAIAPLLQPFMQYTTTPSRYAHEDRLLQLLTKGLLYEACVDYCQARATNTEEQQPSDPTSASGSTQTQTELLRIPELLDDTQRDALVDETDFSLVSWLLALPVASFGLPFEQHTFQVRRTALVLPTRSAASQEHARAPIEAYSNPGRVSAVPTGAVIAAQSSTIGSDVPALGPASVSGSQKVSEARKPLMYADMNHTWNTQVDASSFPHSTTLPKFMPVTQVEDQQAVRAVAWHPTGQFYAVGSNSRVLRIIAYPNVVDSLQTDSFVGTLPATVLHKRQKYHRGSIYCLAWNGAGELLASGSNDKTIRLLRFDGLTATPGVESELMIHDGTVRDLAFLDEALSSASATPTCLLLSAGTDCRVYCTDCASGGGAQLTRTFDGHSAQISALFVIPGGGGVFATAAADCTARLWDLRSPDATQIVSAASPFASVCTDPAGRLLCGAHEDASCSLYDIRGARMLQTFTPHADEVRSARIANVAPMPGDTYGPLLLTGSYDRSISLTDICGDLVLPLSFAIVGEHRDKVIQCRWHPTRPAFVSTSADRTAVCWCSF